LSEQSIGRAQLGIAAANGFLLNPAMPGREKLSEFTAWCEKNVTGDEKGRAQVLLDCLFQAFGQAGSPDVGGYSEFRIRRS
jgi:hypothetical protein